MTIETSLNIIIDTECYLVSVIMVRIESVSYFFIRDKEPSKSLLSGKVLELTYTGSFSLTEFAGRIKSPGIPAEWIAAIEEELLKKELLWFYEEKISPYR